MIMIEDSMYMYDVINHRRIPRYISQTKRNRNGGKIAIRNYNCINFYKCLIINSIVKQNILILKKRLH